MQSTMYNGKKDKLLNCDHKDGHKLIINGLNCFFVNARSLVNNFKIEDLQLYAADLNLHIIGIAETWLNDNIANSEVCLRGFTMYRRDRLNIKEGRGGGVLYLLVMN